MATASRRFTRCERGPVVHLLGDAEQLVRGTAEQVFAGEGGAGTAAGGQAVATDQASGARGFKHDGFAVIGGKEKTVDCGRKTGSEPV